MIDLSDAQFTPISNCTQPTGGTASARHCARRQQSSRRYWNSSTWATLNDNCSAGAEALDAEGLRYWTKCRRLATQKGSRRLSFARRLPDRPFDGRAALLLDDRFRVLRNALVFTRSSSHAPSRVDSVKAWRSCGATCVWALPRAI
jgi:hypothetical protein